MLPPDAQPSCIALVPARAGSKRIPSKNVRPLAGHPLLAYTVAAARASGVFAAVLVSTEDEGIAAIARRYGAEVPFLRPVEFAGDLSPDIEWVRHTLQTLADAGRRYDCFSLLRPTSPFRLPETIQRAWARFRAHPRADSLRAVELCGQHPGKMWVLPPDEALMRPLLPDGPRDPPWHSRPYQDLPRVYVQNASLEIAWTRVALEDGSIAGERVLPFVTEGQEGFDINTRHDWIVAETLLAEDAARLPPLDPPT